MKVTNSALIIACCITVAHGDPRKIQGPRRRIGAGFLRTYMVAEDDTILELGVEFDEELMEVDQMPTERSDGRNNIVDPATGETVHYCCGHEAEIETPRGNSIDHPFDHIAANWNPQGHSGPGYGAPHWDLHIYTMSKQERESIDAPPLDDTCDAFEGVFIPMTCSDFWHVNQPIPCDEQPPFHILPGAGFASEPHMGSHLIPVLAPESNGGSFTHTWIFGIQAGHLAFWEPMFTVAFMKSLASGDILDGYDGEGTISEMPDGGYKVVAPIYNPPAGPVAGRYPTTYTMLYDGSTNTYRVSLTDMIELSASTGECRPMPEPEPRSPMLPLAAEEEP